MNVHAHCSLALILAAGCVPPPQPAEPSPPPLDDPEAVVPPATLEWLDVVDGGIDCPMTVMEARSIHETPFRGGEVAYLTSVVSCFCDVDDRRYRLYYRGCAANPAPHRLDGFIDTTPDLERLLAWQHRLAAKVKAGVPPEQLTRRSSLKADLATIHEQVAANGAPDSEHWQSLQKSLDRLRADVAGNHACLLEQDLKSLELHLANHERIDLRGRKSAPGRALVREAAQLVAPKRKAMRACDLLASDKEYQRLEAELENANHDLGVERRHAGKDRDAASCDSETEDSRTCRAAIRAVKIEKRMEAIERRYGID